MKPTEIQRERIYARLRGRTLPRVLVADPSWRFEDQLPGEGRGALAYQGGDMSVAEICTFPLPPLRRDCWLFLWRVASLEMPMAATAVCKAWGFEPYGELVWRKVKKDGSARMGMGHFVRYSHEVCIIGKRGKPKVLSRDVRSVFDAQIPPKVDGKSVKPNEFYKIVERLAPAPYLELFSRKRRKGWTCVGDRVAA